MKHPNKKGSLNITECIQLDMARPRCEDCKVKYKGHRQGDYNIVLKTCYVREGEKGVFIKIGFWCPSCHRYYDLSLSKKGGVIKHE